MGLTQRDRIEREQARRDVKLLAYAERCFRFAGDNHTADMYREEAQKLADHICKCNRQRDPVKRVKVKRYHSAMEWWNYWYDQTHYCGYECVELFDD